MGERSAARVESLPRALKHRDYVEVVRGIKKSDRIEGHVVDLGRRWVLLAISTDGSPDGYVVLRLRDITKIYWASGGRFVRHSLKAQKAWPPAPPKRPIDLDHGLKRLVNSVAEASALVTIHPERDRADICYIGRPIRWRRRTLHLHEVDPTGRWKRGVEKHRRRAITRVDFARMYDTNLAAVAGHQPPQR